MQNRWFSWADHKARYTNAEHDHNHEAQFKTNPKLHFITINSITFSLYKKLQELIILLIILENLRTFTSVGDRNSVQRTTAHLPLHHHKRNLPVDQRSLRLKTHQWRRRRLSRLRNRKQWRPQKWKRRRKMMMMMISHLTG